MGFCDGMIFYLILYPTFLKTGIQLEGQVLGLFALAFTFFCAL